LWPTLSFYIKNNLFEESANKNCKNEYSIDSYIEDSLFKYLINQRKVLSLSQRHALASEIRKALDKGAQILNEEIQNNVGPGLH